LISSELSQQWSQQWSQVIWSKSYVIIKQFKYL
jgi:hypothetical protein